MANQNGTDLATLEGQIHHDVYGALRALEQTELAAQEHASSMLPGIADLAHRLADSLADFCDFEHEGLATRQRELGIRLQAERVVRANEEFRKAFRDSTRAAADLAPSASDASERLWTAEFPTGALAKLLGQIQRLAGWLEDDESEQQAERPDARPPTAQT